MLKFAAFEVTATVQVPRGASPETLRAIAKRHHFDFEPRPGFLYVRSRAISSRTNDNYDEFPAEEIEKAYMTFVGKPVFVNHVNDNHRRARGVCIDAALHKHALADGAPDTWAEVLMEIDAINFPKLAEAIRRKRIDRTSMGCFVPGTLVTLADGTQKPIETIALDDEVLTHTGKTEPVTYVMERDYDGVVYDVRTYGQATPLVMTDEHPVWVKRSVEDRSSVTGRKVRSLQGQECLCGRDLGSARSLSAHVREAARHGQPGVHGDLPREDFLGWVEARDVRPGDWVLTPTHEGVGHPGSYPFARLLGYYLAEGNLGWDRKRRPDGPISVEWSFDAGGHKDEIEHVQEVVRLLEAMGYQAAGPYSKANAYSIRCNSPELADRFLSYGAQHSWGKRLHPEVMRWSPDNQRAVLESYLLGDAHFRDGTHAEAGTASQALAQQMHLLALRCGVNMTPPVRQHSPSAVMVGSLPKYSMQAQMEPMLTPVTQRERRGQAYVTDEGMWRQVTDVVMKTYQGKVYNFDVEGDDSYVAADVAVHNCDVEYSICSACGNKATTPAEYCSHIPKRKGALIVRRSAATGKPENHLIRETCYGLKFFENSVLVEEPADPTAAFLGDIIDGSAMAKAASTPVHRTASKGDGFSVERRGDQYVVTDDNGNTKGTHDSKAEAEKQKDAAYASWAEGKSKHSLFQHFANWDDEDDDSNLSHCMRCGGWANLRTGHHPGEHDGKCPSPSLEDREQAHYDSTHPADYCDDDCRWNHAEDRARGIGVHHTFNADEGQDASISAGPHHEPVSRQSGEYEVRKPGDQALCHYCRRPLVDTGMTSLGQVTPVDSVHDATDRGLAQTEGTRQRPLGLSQGSASTDLDHLLGGDLRGATASRDSVLDVVPLSAGHQVLEVLAGRVIAGVTDYFRLAHEAQVGPAVSPGHPGVSGFGQSAIPEEARASRTTASASPGVAGVGSPRPVHVSLVAHFDVDRYATASNASVLRHVPHSSAKKSDQPTHAGMVLKAADTGRVLMLQRSVKDEKDPARGTWEFPGGGIEPGDLTSLHAAQREWEEEVGQKFPEGGHVSHTWRSPNGIYQGHVVVIPEEGAVTLHQGRVVPNPDDPDGDDAEQAAWWDPQHAKKNPALRTEVKHAPWDHLTKAAKVAARHHHRSHHHHRTKHSHPFHHPVSGWRGGWGGVGWFGSSWGYCCPGSSCVGVDTIEGADGAAGGAMDGGSEASRTAAWGDLGTRERRRTPVGQEGVWPLTVLINDRASGATTGFQPNAIRHRGSDEQARRRDWPLRLCMSHLSALHHQVDEHNASNAPDSLEVVTAEAALDPHHYADKPICDHCASQRVRYSSLRKQADEDQCPYDASDSLVGEDGRYVCEEGHHWLPTDSAAQIYHGDGPGRGQIQPEPKTAATSKGLVRHEISAHEVMQGDFLDINGKIRVHKPPLVTETRVVVPHQTRGARSPSITVHSPGDTVNVWRRQNKTAARTASLVGKGHAFWAKPAGEYPFKDPDPSSEHEPYVGMVDFKHGPFHMTRDPETREHHLVDNQNRRLNSVAGSDGSNSEHHDATGVVSDSWHELNQAGGFHLKTEKHTDAYYAAESDRPKPPFAHSDTDPRQAEYESRPKPREHAPKPMGGGGDDEWHGPYEVVQHPETKKFHVVDGKGHYPSAWPGPRREGYDDQISAEVTRDHVDRRMQSKERAKGIADKIFGGAMEIMDPGGTSESRRSQANASTLNDLMHRYEGGNHHPLHPGTFGADDHDKPGDGDGHPYYEVKDPGGSGWKARDYGNEHVEIHHEATDQEHDRVQPSGGTPGGFTERGTKRPGFGHDDLHVELHNWIHGDPHTPRDSGDYDESTGRGYSVAKDHARNEPRIERWQKRNRYTG